MGTDWAHSTAPQQRASCSEGRKEGRKEGGKEVGRGRLAERRFSQRTFRHKHATCICRCTELLKGIVPRLREHDQDAESLNLTHEHVQKKR